MRIALTGGAGFVGANLARAWVARGHEVRVPVRPEGDSWRLDGSGADVARVDITDPSQLTSFLDASRPDVIVSAAAHGAYSQQTDVARMAAVNLLAVETLARWAVAMSVPVLHLGSSSEYGAMNHPPSEVERVRPNSMYAVTKAAGTHVICDAVERHGLDAVVFRLYSVYGPWEDSGRLMPVIVRSALAKELPAQLVDPEVARDFVYIDDVVEIATSWIERPRSVGDPAVVNVASGTQTTIGELVRTVQRTFGIDASPTWGTMERRAWDTSCWIGDPGRAEAALGWRATTSLSDGLSRMAEFFSTRQHGCDD